MYQVVVKKFVLNSVWWSAVQGMKLALFIAGNITKTVDRLVPICEEAMRFKVTVDYDVSVKAIATILVKRSTFFQPLMAKYVMGVQIHTACGRSHIVDVTAYGSRINCAGIPYFIKPAGCCDI